MIETSRRSFLAGLGAALVAPAVIRTPGLIMPVKQRLVLPSLVYAEYAFSPQFARWRQVTFDSGTHFPVMDELGELAPPPASFAA